MHNHHQVLRTDSQIPDKGLYLAMPVGMSVGLCVSLSVDLSACLTVATSFIDSLKALMHDPSHLGII